MHGTGQKRDIWFSASTWPIIFKQRQNCSSPEAWHACLQQDNCVLILQSTISFSALSASEMGQLYSSMSPLRQDLIIIIVSSMYCSSQSLHDSSYTISRLFSGGSFLSLERKVTYLCILSDYCWTLPCWKVTPSCCLPSAADEEWYFPRRPSSAVVESNSSLTTQR